MERYKAAVLALINQRKKIQNPEKKFNSITDAKWESTVTVKWTCVN